MFKPRKQTRKNRHMVPSIPLRALPNTIIAFFIGCGVGFILFPLYHEPTVPIVLESQAQIQVCFSPEGHCADKVVSAIEGAKESILVMSYSFTSTPIASALLRAHERGVNVRVLVDKSQLKGKYTKIPYLAQHNIPIYVDSVEGISHNKVMILDESSVLSGSFNWSEAANSKNAENILFIKDPSLAKIYKENWEKRAFLAKTL